MSGSDNSIKADLEHATNIIVPRIFNGEDLCGEEEDSDNKTGGVNRHRRRLVYYDPTKPSYIDSVIDIGE